MQLILRRHFYYGWYVLAAVSGINFANGVTAIGVLTVFILPLTNEFSWTQTQIAAATSIGAILGAVAAPFTGRLTDRFGARVILVIGGLLIVVAMVNLAAMTTLAWFYIAFGVARLSDQAFVQATSPPAIAKWFLRLRGRAVAVLFVVSSAGGVVLPLLVQFVIDMQGWRAAYLALAAVMLVFGLLPTALFVRRQPEDMGLRIDGDAVPQSASSTKASATDSEVHWRLGEASRTLTLWLLLVSMFLLGFVSTGVSLHIVPYLVGEGIDNTAAVGAVSVMFFVSAAGNIGFGYLVEKVSVRFLFAAVFGLRTLGIGVLLMADSLPEAYLFAVIHGLTEGGLRTISTIMLADYYGRRFIGSIYGLSRSFQVAGFALGPIISGIVFDSTNSYSGAFISFLFLALFGIILIALARKPVKRSNAT